MTVWCHHIRDATLCGHRMRVMCEWWIHCLESILVWCLLLSSLLRAGHPLASQLASVRGRPNNWGIHVPTWGLASLFGKVSGNQIQGCFRQIREIIHLWFLSRPKKSGWVAKFLLATGGGWEDLTGESERPCHQWQMSLVSHKKWHLHSSDFQALVKNTMVKPASIIELLPKYQSNLLMWWCHFLSDLSHMP